MSHALWWLQGLAGGVLLAVGPAWAHKGSDAYMEVHQVREEVMTPSAASPTLVSYRFLLAVAIKDLNLLLPLDANSNGKVTWGEVKAALPSVTALANETVSLDASTNAQPAGALRRIPAPTACRLDWQPDGLDRRSDGTYVRLKAQARCPANQALALRYTLLAAQDANHRLLVAGRVGGVDLLTTLSPFDSDRLELISASVHSTGPLPPMASPSGRRWQASRDYFVLGMQHLMEGYDHLAFLLALVLPLRLPLTKSVPAVASETDKPVRGGITGSGPAGGAWWALLRTVTAFTIGHSLTLILATLGWTPASPRWVEPAIALTIAFTALLNLRPLPWVRTDVLALLFGMVHGFGFASLLMEATAPSGLLPWALGGFNLGVEAGQLVAVCGWVLLSQLALDKPWYPTLVVRGGSVLLLLLAAWWFWQRVS